MKTTTNFFPATLASILFFIVFFLFPGKASGLNLVVDNGVLKWSDGSICKIVEANSPETPFHFNDYAWMDWLRSKGVNTLYCTTNGTDGGITTTPYINNNQGSGFDNAKVNQWVAMSDYWVNTLWNGKGIVHILLSEKETHDKYNAATQKEIMLFLVQKFAPAAGNIIWDREEYPTGRTSQTNDLYGYLKSIDLDNLRGMHNNTGENPWSAHYNSDLIQFLSFQESTNSFDSRIESEVLKFTQHKTTGYASEMTGGFQTNDVAKAQTIFNAAQPYNAGAGVYISCCDQRNTSDNWYRPYEPVYLRLAQLAGTNVTPTPVFNENVFAVFGDYGDDNPNELAVSTLVKSWNPGTVITTGDNSYGTNTNDVNVGKYYAKFIGNYSGNFGPGATTNRFYPSLGNHDWDDGGGLSAYQAYFTLPGNERYYTFTKGDAQFFIIDSDDSEPSGRTGTSVQAQWLQAGLQSSNAIWKIVVLHHSPYSSGGDGADHGSTPVMQWNYEDWGADAVFSGHDHIYERIHKDVNNDGKTLYYFVTGTGGRPLDPLGATVAGSQKRINNAFGSVKLTVWSSNLSVQFISVAGNVLDQVSITKSATPPCSGTLDCNNVCNGTAALDSCGTCAGGNTGITPCIPLSNTIQFWLINASTDTKLFEITNNMTFSNSTNINVSVEGPGVQSPVRIFYDGSQTAYEIHAPFSVFGESNGNYDPFNFTSGSHTIRAKIEGTTRERTVNFTVGTVTVVPGCTDPIATNYNSAATVDDGSCQYVQPCNGTLDCNNVCNGAARIDSCGTCAGGNTGITPCVPATGTIQFWLINASTDIKLFEITNNMTFSNSTNINISVEGSGVQPPVRTFYDGNQSSYENAAPFSVFGDNNGNYDSFNFTPGNHSIRAKIEGTTRERTINFTVGTVNALCLRVNCDDGNACTLDTCVNGVCLYQPNPSCAAPCVHLQVVSFTLVRASNGTDISLLTSGTVINLSTIGNFSVKADVCDSAVGSVKFTLNGNIFQTENYAPYSINGDNNNGATYTPWNPNPGNYTLIATPYSGTDGTGTAGVSKTVSFTVANGSSKMEEGELTAMETMPVSPHIAGDFTVYPNPFTEKLVIDFAAEDEGTARIRMINSIGQAVVTETIQFQMGENKHTLYLDKTLPGGIYLLELDYGTHKEHRKIYRLVE